ncbi:MAG: tripartite tricarboxylate transporter substrate binding protein [Pigmentiphaga sp.]|nr:tripartite tricarboxylate transporter substrate binding protein [Pigmentiphaga sp.]
MRRRTFLGATTASALALSTFGSVRASDYPDKPITLIVPLAPGDAADTIARMLSEELSATLNVPIVISNMPGAGGSIGTQAVVRAPNDGYTLLYAQNSPLTIRRVIDPVNNDYDPLKDLTPLGLATRTPSILVARADAPFADFKEMVALAKAKPGTLRIGNAGPGSAGDISVQLINSQAGTDLASVPYRGAAPAISDLLGGHVDGVILALGAVSPHIRGGRMRGIAISDPFPEFPDVPTLSQLGYGQEIQGVWFAFLAPGGVPANVVDKLEGALAKVVGNPQTAERLLPMGIILGWEPPAKLAEAISREHKTVSELLKQVKKPAGG